jgi:DNA-binding CsgD family transcriptional regulator
MNEIISAPDVLTPSEYNVYRLLVNGYTYKDIASLLIIAPCTVTTHVISIYQKFNVNSRSELMAMRIKELEEVISKMKNNLSSTRV